MSAARDQLTRLLTLVPYLHTRGAVPLSRVARDLGVSAEQVRKDLNVLWFCGLPGPGEQMDYDFEALEGDPDGLVRLDTKGYLPRPVRLDRAEASALIVALRALGETASPEARPVVGRALAKLEEATAGTAGLDVRPPADAARTTAVVATLEQALAEDRQVRLDYYVPTRDEHTTRVVDPLAVLRAEGNDYLDAWCHAAGDRRLFRVSRVEAASLLDSPRVRSDEPPRDLSAGLYEPATDDVVARVRLAPGQAWFVDHYPVDEVETAADGSLGVTLRVRDPWWLVRLALRLAPDLEVVEPDEVAALVRRTASATLGMYRSASVHGVE